MQRAGKRNMRLSQEAWGRLADASAGLRDRDSYQPQKQAISMQSPFPEMNADMQPVYASQAFPSGERLRRMEQARAMERRERKRTSDGFGVRLRVAGPMMLIALAICLMFLLVGVVQVHQARANVRQMTERIANMEEQCRTLQEEYEYAEDSAEIAKKAMALNMIAASAAETVKIQAPENALMTPQTVRMGD